MRYVQYLRYILIHKWYVLLECCRLRIPWLGLTHDLSKLLPSEFFAYADRFFGKGISDFPDQVKRFRVAWLKHQHRNPHHWQHWFQVEVEPDDSSTLAQDMPLRYRKEMLADWLAMARVSGGSAADWYRKNRDKIYLHHKTREYVDGFLG